MSGGENRNKARYARDDRLLSLRRLYIPPTAFTQRTAQRTGALGTSEVERMLATQTLSKCSGETAKVEEVRGKPTRAPYCERYIVLANYRRRQN